MCGAHARPADVWLGWRGRFSFAVEELVAWECAGLPYREAMESLEKLAALAVSVHAAEEIAARWGKARLPLRAYAQPVEKDLVIEIDGSKAQPEEGWKEIKLGACFSWDREHPDKDPEQVSYCADWESAERFHKTMWLRSAGARGEPSSLPRRDRRLQPLGSGSRCRRSFLMPLKFWTGTTLPSI